MRTLQSKWIDQLEAMVHACKMDIVQRSYTASNVQVLTFLPPESFSSWGHLSFDWQNQNVKLRLFGGRNVTPPEGAVRDPNDTADHWEKVWRIDLVNDSGALERVLDEIENWLEDQP